MVNRLYPDQGAYGPADGIRARPSLTLYPICITTRIDWCRLIGDSGHPQPGVHYSQDVRFHRKCDYLEPDKRLLSMSAQVPAGAHSRPIKLRP